MLKKRRTRNLRREPREKRNSKPLLKPKKELKFRPKNSPRLRLKLKQRLMSKRDSR